MEGFKIFLVEDDDSIRKLISDRIETKGIEVDSAPNGLEALQKISSDVDDYYLIISDINMPKMNGLALISQLKELGFRNKIAIMSSLDDVRVFKEAIRLGVDYFVDKPIQLQNLDGIIQKAKKSYEKKIELDYTMQLLSEYKDAVDKSTIVSKTDKTGKITFVNDKFCEISGFSPEELIGKPHSIIRHPDMPKSAFEDLWHTIKDKKEAWRGIVKNRTKEGGTYIVDATIVPILDRRGEVLEYIAIRHDVTELEQYRELLEDQLDTSIHSLQDKMNLLSEYEKAINISAPFSRFDTNGVITHTNSAFEHITGFNGADIVGKNFFEIFGNSETIFIIEGAVSKIKKTKQPWKGVVILNSKEKDSIYLNCSLVPIIGLDGKIVEIMGIYADITEVINLNKEIENTQKEIIFRVGMIGESRSKETGLHVKRVAEISAILAKDYGLDAREIDLLKNASPMHDIGKIAIPDSILNKPDRLSKEEYEIIKTHAEVGYELLKGSDRELLKTAATIAYEHHERWDGKGYPRGLAGEEINILGRITAIADVYDALATDRCYKKAWELEKILMLFREERGQQFDPSLVDIFLNRIDEIVALSSDLKDD